MNRRYFITGTDTGVGKTVVTAALMVAWQARGIRCAPVKPVQTGGITGDDDLAWCLTFAEPAITGAERAALVMHRYALPVSPHLAAREAGERLSVQSLETRIAELSNHWNILIIEGAGGLLVPLNETETMADLITATRAVPILVTRDTLGTLNHTALTLQELKRRGLTPAAVVINQSTPPRDAIDRRIREDNVVEITRLAGKVPVVAWPYQSEINRTILVTAGASLAKAVEQGDGTGCPQE